MLRDTAGTFAELVTWIDSASFIFLIAAVMGAEITLIAVWAYRKRNLPSWYAQGSITLLKTIVGIAFVGVIFCVLYFAIGGGAFNTLAAVSAGAVVIIYAALAAVFVIVKGSADRNSPQAHK